MNDKDAELHNICYHTDPLNLEVQLLAWAINDDTTPLGKTIFLYYTIINRGSDTIEDAYVGLWADTDLGYASDDESACDTTLNLTYGYNGIDIDEIYGASVPALGVCLLQGPAVHSFGDTAFQFMHKPIQNAKLLNMTSNTAYYSGIVDYGDPEYTYSGAIKLHGNLQGLDRYGNPRVDPTTGLISPFMNSGDPITNSGWLQNLYLPPCDPRIMLGSGPFSMESLDTQQVIYALIIGHDKTRLESIMDLKCNTNFVRGIFDSEFKIKAVAETKVNFITETETELSINAHIASELDITSVYGELLNYNNSLIHAIQLYDDGLHNDAAANDKIFGNIWRTYVSDTALYLNLKIVDPSYHIHLFSHLVENITLFSNRVTTEKLNILLDHINNDGKPNPGENIRFTLNVKNNFEFDLQNFSVVIKSDDPYIRMEPKYFFIPEFNTGESKILTYEIDIFNDIPDSHTINFDVTFFDYHHHTWNELNYISLQVQPFSYVPNEIFPDHVSGYSDAYFIIRIIKPEELTGHSYSITVNALNTFNLIDQTLGHALLRNHVKPDKYAYNIPITDGFKIIEAYLPNDKVKWSHDDVAGGHPNPFRDLKMEFGEQLPDEEFCEVELEYTNSIDSSGVIGVPMGQGGFNYYRWFLNPGDPISFVACPFNVWKIENGKRKNRLNICFADNYPIDGIWTLRDWLYIMTSEYDSSGRYFYDPGNNPKKELMYEISRTWINIDGTIDAGDKIIISREFSATNEDMWMFIPTGIIKRNAPKPNSFALCQNYPNPFNPTTTIRFSLDKASLVSLKIYNILGQEVIELFNEEAVPGIYIVHWDGKNNFGQPVSSGLYFAKLISTNQSKLIKMLLIR